MPMQLIQPNEAMMVQKPPRTQSHALKPPSGKSAGFGGDGTDATFSRSLAEPAGATSWFSDERSSESEEGIC